MDSHRDHKLAEGRKLTLIQIPVGGPSLSKTNMIAAFVWLEHDERGHAICPRRIIDKVLHAYYDTGCTTIIAKV